MRHATSQGSSNTTDQFRQLKMDPDAQVNGFKNKEDWLEQKPSNDPGYSAIGNYQPGSEEERKLLRKLDTRIIV